MEIKKLCEELNKYINEESSEESYEYTLKIKAGKDKTTKGEKTIEKTFTAPSNFQALMYVLGTFNPKDIISLTDSNGVIMFEGDKDWSDKE